MTSRCSFLPSLLNRSFRFSCNRRMRTISAPNSSPKFSLKLLLDIRDKTESAELKNHRKHASGVLKSAANLMYRKPADHSMKVHWGHVLEQAWTASVDQLAQLLRNLASLDQETFDKAAVMSSEGAEGDKSILKELREVFTERFLQSSHFSDFAFSPNELFVFGDVFTKMNLVHDPLLDWVLCSLTPFFGSFSIEQLVAASFLAHANSQMPEETASSLEGQIQIRSYQLEAEQLSLLILPFNCSDHDFETSCLTDQIVAEKAVLWLKTYFGSSNLREGKIEVFQTLLENLAINGKNVFKRHLHIRFFAPQILSAFNETVQSDSNVPFSIWTAFMHYFRAVRCDNTSFMNRAVKRLHSLYSIEDVAQMKIKDLSDFVSAYTRSSFEISGSDPKIFELVEGRIRQQLASGQLEDQSNSDLMVILYSLAINDRLPEDLLLHVLNETFYSTTVETLQEEQNAWRHFRMPWNLYFLDSCVQFHPKLRSRLPRCPDIVLEAIREDRNSDMFKKGVRSVAVDEVCKMLGSLLEVGQHAICIGRVLPHFKSDDVLLQYGLDGLPTAFQLDSTIRLLDVDTLRLPPGRKGLVLILMNSGDLEKPLHLKVEQLQFLGYKVKLVAVYAWRNMAVGKRRVYLQNILQMNNVLSAI